MLKNLLRRLIDIDHLPAVRHEQLDPLINDYERSPLRFELEVLLEEYKALRAEIEHRITSEQQIISFALGLIATVFTLSQIIPSLSDRYPQLLTSLRPAYLVLSLVFSTFALMSIQHDAMMASMGTYIEHSLRPRIERILTTVTRENLKAFEWEEFRTQFQFRQLHNAPFFYLLAGSRYAITIVPSLVLTFMYWQEAAIVTQKPI